METVSKKKTIHTPGIFRISVPTNHKRVLDFLAVAAPIAVLVNGPEVVQHWVETRSLEIPPHRQSYQANQQRPPGPFPAQTAGT